MGNRKIAIIDEDKEFIKELEEVLAACGHESVVVHDARVAIDTIVHKKPDLILLELVMPRKNGFELANEISRKFESRRIPIIAMSVLVRKEFNWLLDLCGINGYLRKPFHPLDVIWAIENAAVERSPLERLRNRCH